MPISKIQKMATWCLAGWCGMWGMVRADEPTHRSVTAELKDAITKARDKVFPSLVSVVSVVEYQEGGRQRLSRSGGSGTIISEQGHIVTNAHVTQDCTKFKVILSDKRELEAKLVGEDPLSDIAVLQLDVSKLGPDEKLPVAKFGDSTQLDIGDYVMAMGAPWGMSRSMSLGVINNNDRVLSNFFQDDADYETRLDQDQPTGSYYRWLQHDSAIAPGNSGGPLVNLKGEIVGVNTRGAFFAGDMGFASPSSVVKDIAADLVQFGEVQRSFLGIKFKPIKTTGYDYGVLVNSVLEGSPADQAGLKPGDLVTAIDGQAITIRYVEELPDLMRDLADREIGSKITLAYERTGQKMETTLITEKYTKDRGDLDELKRWGFTVQDITPRMARNRRLPTEEGVLVTGVEVGRPAQEAKPPLQNDDVIRAVNGTQIKDLSGLLAAYNQLSSQQPAATNVLIEFEREGGKYISVLKPSEDDNNERPNEVAKAWIGVEAQPVIGDLAKELKLEDKTGFRVVKVYENTLAASSELQPGDVILAINDKPLKPRTDEDQAMFQREIKKLDIGSQTLLTVLRDGAERKISVELEPTRMTIDEAPREKNRDFDLEVRDITFFDISNKRWKPDTKGVWVIQVETGGWAGVANLRTGDLIVQVDDREVTNVKTFKKVMADIEKARPEKVRLLVMRGIETRFLFVETDWQAHQN